jgi:hypothetical protein
MQNGLDVLDRTLTNCSCFSKLSAMIADVLQAPETDAGARVERPWVKCNVLSIIRRSSDSSLK